MSTQTIYVFYAGLLYGEFPEEPYYKRSLELRNLPDGAYLRYPKNIWYRSDFTPVLIEDVPPELRAFMLLLS